MNTIDRLREMHPDWRVEAADDAATGMVSVLVSSGEKRSRCHISKDFADDGSEIVLAVLSAQIEKGWYPARRDVDRLRAALLDVMGE